ncbi:MAG: transmembrane anti-sigma factor [Comamonadaceae bacterium]|nr:MAG: transmembrane anti-sigma factor [Comamonadaceae bacterium]
MAHSTHPTLTDDELHILVDAQGTPEQLATLQDKLADDLPGQTRLAQWQTQRDALRSLHSKVMDEAIPPALLQAARRAQHGHQVVRQGWHYGGLAAGVVLAFAAGWLANSHWLKVPDLTAQGFDLVGGRLLPGDTGARAQFMFQNTTGHRITLYLGALDPTSEPGLSRQETAFRYEPQAGLPSFYWIDQGFGYALAGELPRAELMKLADTVYRQLL